MRKRRIVSGLLFALSASCAGGGGGCSGCGGGPIIGGFPQEAVVPNGGTVRVTRTGLDFMAANFGAIAASALGENLLTFPIPESTQSVKIPILPDPTVKLCMGGPKPTQTPPECIAEIGVGAAKLHIDAATPNVLRLSGTLPVELRSLPVRVDYGVTVDLKAALGESPSCSGGTPVVRPKQVPVIVEIPIVEETLAPRKGYAKLDIANAKIDPKLDSDDAILCWNNCAGALQPICNGVANFVKDRVFNTVIDGVKNQLKSALENFLCTKPAIGQTPVCPVGGQANAKKSKCVYTAKTDECIPIALGVETRLDPSKALASFSSGPSGGLNLVVAGGGNLDPAPGASADNAGYTGHTPNGLTLGLLGGTSPSPISACVPAAKLTVPVGIPRPDELRLDTPPGWPAGTPKPDLGIALSGRFLEYAFGNAYNSGMLCLNLTTDTMPAVRSGLLSFLAPSLPKLTLEQADSAIAIITKPKKAPKLKIGTGTDINADPLLSVDFPEFGLDFYVWSYDRFIRVFSLSGDLTLPINLTTAKDAKKNPDGGLLVSLGEVKYVNATVTNSELLMEDPATLAGGISSVIGSISNQLSGAIPALNLSSAVSSLGLGLEIPPSGIIKITKGTDDFVALFAKMKVAPAKTTSKLAPMIHIEKVDVDGDALTAENAERSRLPVLTVTATSRATDAEYSFAIDEGTRSPWIKESRFRVQTDDLFMQGKHRLLVWARSGPELEDPEPAEAPFTIDVRPPLLELTGQTLRARDLVSDDLRFRTRADDGTAGDWQGMPREGNVSAVSLASNTRSVEVSDETGNIASLDVRTEVTEKAGACSTGASKSGNLAAFVGFLALALLRRRREHT